MKLLIDIGNTNTSIAVVDGSSIIKRYFVHTSKKEFSITAFKRLLGKHRSDIDKVILVSVVPPFLKVIKKALQKAFLKANILVVGEDIKVPLKNKYKKPGEVGQDRLVISFAASAIYGDPVVAVDFGTAVTMDYVNAEGAYEGGFIFPGLRLGLGALSEDTALLPSVGLSPARGLIGRDTRTSMNNGILFGYASMCDGLIQKIKERYGEGVKVVATGGDSALIGKYSRYINNICPDLIFEGLKMLG